MFQRMVLASVVAGGLAGVALTALQSGAVAPLLLAAETYEAAAADPSPLRHSHGELSHSHAFGDRPHEHDGHAVRFEGDGAAAPTPGGATGPARSGGDSSAHRHDGHAHHHGHGDAWAPEDGLQRTFWTSVSNVATAIGFALLLVAVFAWRGKATWRHGLLWGAAGFVVFFLNPAISLHPEIPGTLAADLVDRQLWWLFAVACSAAGVGLLLLAPRTVVKLGGAVLLAVPHLAGAPHPEVTGGLAPAELADSFVVAAAATNAAFWLILGLASATTFRRLSPA